eukprot:UC1_evm1s697
MPDTVHKLAAVDSLSVYWNTDCQPLRDLSQRRFVEEMRALIPTPVTPVSHNFMIAPVTLEVRLILNTVGESARIPKVTAKVHMERLEICFDEDQYDDLMHFTDSLSRFSRQSEFLALRPHRTPYTGHARAWWGYALNATLQTVRDKQREWSWSYYAERRDKRLQYRAAYEDLLKAQYAAAGAKVKGSEALTARVKELEADIDFDDVVRYRQMSLEAVPRPPKPVQKKGWLSGWFGGGGSDGVSQN